MLGPTLETDRLLLRPPSAEDFDAWLNGSLGADALRPAAAGAKG